MKHQLLLLLGMALLMCGCAMDPLTIFMGGRTIDQVSAIRLATDTGMVLSCHYDKDGWIDCKLIPLPKAPAQ